MGNFLEDIELIGYEAYPYCPIISDGSKLRQCIGGHCAVYNKENGHCNLLHIKIESFIKYYARYKEVI